LFDAVAGGDAATPAAVVSGFTGAPCGLSGAGAEAAGRGGAGSEAGAAGEGAAAGLGEQAAALSARTDNITMIDARIRPLP
jgi:hypothetical protein